MSDPSVPSVATFVRKYKRFTDAFFKALVVVFVCLCVLYFVVFFLQPMLLFQFLLTYGDKVRMLEVDAM